MYETYVRTCVCVWPTVPELDCIFAYTTLLGTLSTVCQTRTAAAHPHAHMCTAGPCRRRCVPDQTHTGPAESRSHLPEAPDRFDASSTSAGSISSSILLAPCGQLGRSGGGGADGGAVAAAVVVEARLDVEDVVKAHFRQGDAWEVFVEAGGPQKEGAGVVGVQLERRGGHVDVGHLRGWRYRTWPSGASREGDGGGGGGGDGGTTLKKARWRVVEVEMPAMIGSSRTSFGKR